MPTGNPHRTIIVVCPNDKRKVVCACGYQSVRFDSAADAASDASRHASMDAPEDGVVGRL